MRTPRRFTPALLLVLLASPAGAAGIDLAWDACRGEPAATSAKHFACDVNTGGESLWLSFESPITGNPGLVEVALEFRTLGGGPLPAWWDFKDFASCRRGALGDATEPTNWTPTCASWTFGVIPSFEITRIDYQFPTADVGRMVMGSRTAGSVTAGQRYLACRVQLTHARSTGLQACAGCQEPMRITLTAVNVAGHVMTQPITQNYVLWQSAPTHARATTWAAVKSLYR